MHHSVESPVNVAAQLFDAPEGFYRTSGMVICRISRFDESQIWFARDARQMGQRARTTKMPAWHVAEERIEERVLDAALDVCL